MTDNEDWWAKRLADEQASFQANVSEGFGDRNPLLDDMMLARRVEQMTHEEFAAHRREFGLSKSTFDHLAGN